MLTINIASLTEGTHEFVLRPEAEEIGLEADRFEDVEVRVRLSVYDEKIVASLHVETDATLECDRTLRLFKKRLDGDFMMLFAPQGTFGEGEAEDYDDVRLLDPYQREIDLADVARDTILLAVPARCVAPGAEDIEIPTHFGESQSGVDPRWEVLARLRSGDSAGS